MNVERAPKSSALRGVVRGAVNTAARLLPRATRPGDTLILAYHNVVYDISAEVGDRSLHLRLSDFEQQLEIIRKEADVVPLWDALTRVEKNSRRVAITFDDAYAGACELGVPSCIAQSFPATVFVAPGLFERFTPWDLLAQESSWNDAQRRHFLWDDCGMRQVSATPSFPEHTLPLLRIAGAKQVAALAKESAVTIGNHTLGHANLGALGHQDVVRQLREAQTILRELAGTSYLPVLAYPFGIPAVAPHHALREASIEFALRVSGGYFRSGERIDIYGIPRMNVPAGISSSSFHRCLRGWLPW